MRALRAGSYIITYATRMPVRSILLWSYARCSNPVAPFLSTRSHVVAMAALSSLRGGLLFAVYAVCMLLVLVRADTEADTSSARPRSDYDFVWWFPFS